MKYGKILFLILLAVSMLNCAKKKEKADVKKEQEQEQPGERGGEVPGDDDPPPGDTPQNPEDRFQSGGTATFVPRLSAFSRYAGRPINRIPEDFVVNVDMVEYDNGRYGGRVTMSYKDENGRIREWPFSTGGSEKAIKYNKWLTEGSEFHAVFVDEDIVNNLRPQGLCLSNFQAYPPYFQWNCPPSDTIWGSIVLIIDGVVNLGDGQGAEDIVHGSIWFKNFGRSPIPVYPPSHCWYVRTGPYDCRPWPKKGGMKEDVLKPTSGSGYEKLGTFTGLSLSKAFDN